MSPLPCGLSRDHRPRYVSGTPRPYAGGRIWIGRFSSLPCARRNGRASASLTARGGGLPIGVITHFTWCEPVRGGAGGVFIPIARRSAEEYPESTRGAHLCSPPVSAHGYFGELHYAAQRHATELVSLPVDIILALGPHEARTPWQI